MLNIGPPNPSYTQTWDVHLVQNYLDCLGKTKLLPLKLLSIKLAILFALSWPERAVSLAKLDLRHCSFLPTRSFPSHLCLRESEALHINNLEPFLRLFHTMRYSAPLALCALIFKLHETYIQFSCHLNQTHCFLCQTTQFYHCAHS